MKPLHEIFGDYYSPEHVLSYGRRWICSIGSRSIGKSTGWIIFVLFRFLRYGDRFIYIRRRDDEARDTARTACDSAVQILQDGGWEIYSIEAKRGHFYCKRTKDGKEEEAGSYFGLNLADKKKSSNFGDHQYKWILYDEFISLDRTRYLGTAQNFLFEYIKADELYTTVDRRIGNPAPHDVTIVFIANAATYYNPIFLGLGVDMYITTDSKTVAPRGVKWVCEQTKTVPATEKIQQNKAVTDIEKRLAAYNRENMTFDDSPAFVGTVREPMDAICSVIYNGHKMGVYLRRDGSVYISNKATQLETIALTAGDTGGVNYYLLDAPVVSDYIGLIKDRFYTGRCTYQTQKIKFEISNYMMKIPYI